TGHWLRDALQKFRVIIPHTPQTQAQWSPEWIDSSRWGQRGVLSELPQLLVDSTAENMHAGFDYSVYEFCQRDHPLLMAMQKGDTRHFVGCERVLDVGCGAGIFLDCLRQQNIVGLGVERDPVIANYARGMGLDVIDSDALEFLEQTDAQFDGIYCSHFVEHLSFDSVKRLIRLLTLRLRPGGVVVLTFPDPESIRSQLLGFWRDPEHVRFYHPSLISALAVSEGLQLEWSSVDAQPHQVVPFSEQPPPIASWEALPGAAGEERQSQYAPGKFDRFLEKLGLVPAHRIESLERNQREWIGEVKGLLEHQQQINTQLEQRTSALWDVSKTWAWNDNATLKLRKHGA
ncbi:MAG: methyltransferase domain-containing protein, partial [Halieaceae bacterium]|nr:methyltransferase domain-containing protein [Halieaceae bacterium]